VGSNCMDHETCNDMYDDDILYDVFAPACSVLVFLVAAKLATKATPAALFSIGKGRGRKDWIDATISALKRLNGTLEETDTPG
jgi:hypothetical protein